MREMKDSGIEWIGEIPKDWKIIKGKYVLEYLQKPVKDDDGVITCFRDGEVTLRSNRREDGFTLSDKEIGYQGIDVGDLVVHGMDGFAGAIGISDSRGKASPVLNVFNSKYSKRYLMYYLRSMAFSNVFIALASGIRVRSCDLSWNKLANLPYPTTSYEEQTEIVRYIDSQCSEIDATAEDIQKEITLLEDYKKSVITEAVTKGLNPDSEMKDSGIEWIGEIPKDWDLLKIGYVTKEISDIDHYMPSDSDDIDKVPYLMIGDLKENISQIDFESCKYISKKVYRALSIKSKPEKENVIFARYATIGTVCFVDSEKQLLVSYACLTVKANELIKGRFLFYYFKSNAFLEEVSQYVKSNTQGNIGKESLIRAKIVVPKLKEQTQIISYLDSKCSEIDSIIADKKRQLYILAEYKKSLIYEYVTGKKEVPINE